MRSCDDGAGVNAWIRRPPTLPDPAAIAATDAAAPQPDNTDDDAHALGGRCDGAGAAAATEEDESAEHVQYGPMEVSYAPVIAAFSLCHLPVTCITTPVGDFRRA